MRALLRLLLVPLAGWSAGPVLAAHHLPDPRIDDLIVEPVAGAPQVNVRAILSGSGRTAFHGTLELTLGEKVVRLPVTLDAGPAGAVGGLHFNQLMPLKGAKPWSPARPVLYQMQAALLHDGDVTDRRTVRFGVRTIALQDGWLLLNGEREKVRALEYTPAWSLTLSARARDSLVTRDMEQVHAAGFNLLLAEPGLLDDLALDWCDRHGLMVAEGRRESTGSPAADVPCDFDLADTEVVGMVQAHRNHAALVLWRIACAAGSRDVNTLARLIAASRQLDPSRPAIGATPWPDIRVDARPITDGDLAALDLTGLFGTATAFNEARAAVDLDRARRRIGRIRADPDAPGYVVPRQEPGLAGATAARLLSITPGPVLLLGGAPLSVTLLVSGGGPLPRHTVLDWRLQAPGDDPALPMPWRQGPVPAADGTAILAAPPFPVQGRWDLAVQVRTGLRILATAEEAVYVVQDLEGSQQSFALLDDAPAIQDAFGAWVIPAPYAAQAVVARSGNLGATELAGALDLARAGRKIILFEVTAPVLDAIRRQAPGLLPDDAPLVDASATDCPVFTGPKLSRGLPGFGRGEPGRALVGALYTGLLPLTHLPVPAGATLHAASLVRDTDAGPPRRLADIMEVAVGKGRVVFCQYRVLDRLPEPLARALFYRLLGL
jgi:hypothetical protein